MVKDIDYSKSVYELVKDHPEVLDIMAELGFDSIKKPGMLSTAGRFMTIPQGAKMKGVALEEISQEFRRRGYQVKE